MHITDTHAHPFEEAFDEDREQVMARATEAGVKAMLCPAVDSASHERLFALCDTWPELCFPAMGLHPTSVNGNPAWRQELDIVERLLGNGNRKFYAVGEIGLDLHWEREWLDQQREAFAAQAELALRFGLPVAIHVRDAWPQMLDMLRSFRGRGLRGVMHAFSGTEEEYAEVERCGDFLFGIGGTVTYKKSPLPDLVARMPLGKMVLETDAPYLPPVPFRGKRNEPAYIARTCARVAEIKGMTPTEIAAVTTLSARRMFGIG